jgi:hypothetical protein
LGLLSAIGLLIGLLAGCGYIPRPVEGVPPGAPWSALPLRKWLAENRAEPEAMAFCAPPECRPGLAVGVIRLDGHDAEVADAVLKDPERLARALRASAGRTKPVKTLVSVETMTEGAFYGFSIALIPADESKAPAYGAALGQRSENGLRLVLVIGEDLEPVQATVREVAVRELRP